MSSAEDSKRLVKLSKRLSRVLRHEPEKFGLELDPGGWVEVGRLLDALDITRTDLDRVVRENDKQRFAFDGTGSRIRASQGHSVPVELGLQSEEPPGTLYHGTHPGAISSILAEGLRKMSRHAVHLSPDVATAIKVGARRGNPVVLRVAAGRMAADGYGFTRSENGVWLVDEVPARYLSVDES